MTSEVRENTNVCAVGFREVDYVCNKYTSRRRLALNIKERILVVQL